MSLAVQIRQHGGPEELQIVDVPVGEPGPGEIRIRHHAVGLNFIDVYHRTGLYPLNMPASIGMEAAGVVEAVGEGVTHLAPGDRAAYASNPPGSYCEARVMPAKTVCKLPDAISFETGAAMMLKGLTAEWGSSRASGPRPWACSSSALPAQTPNASWLWPMARRMPSITAVKTLPRA